MVGSSTTVFRIHKSDAKVESVLLFGVRCAHQKTLEAQAGNYFGIAARVEKTLGMDEDIEVNERAPSDP